MEMKYANEHGWSDVEPHEVVKVVSAKCVEVRAMNAVLADGWKPEMTPGGFAGHCVNNYSQVWNYSSDEVAPVFRIRLGKKGWKDKYGNRFVLSDKPRKFHDYNF